jgi:hypothetical protein
MTQSGQWDPRNYASDFQMLSFLIAQMIGKLVTIVPVQVIAVTRAGSLAGGAYVNVQPMLNQLTGDATAVPHGIICGMPAWRMQGGGNAVILDPVVNDIGLALFSYRPASSLVAADVATPGSVPGSQPVNPASAAQLDWSSGFYLGGWICGAIVQYLIMNASGITAVSPTAITLQAPTVTITASGQLAVNTPTAAFSDIVTVAGDEIVGSVDFLTHTHPGVQIGSSNTGVPNA